jgi:NAD(P)-dependent dehydrogenase (short-subunit alcohol dehydrogenase family)
MIDFNDQVVVVTGAGRGMGRLFSLELARRGAALVVNDLGCSLDGVGTDRTIADEVVKEIADAGGTAVASYADVSSPDEGEAIIETALDNFGRVDAVISNAGITIKANFDAISVDDWRRVGGVHLDGAFYVTQPAFRVMKSQGYGRMVLITSSAGMWGEPFQGGYAAAKAGLLGLMNAIALEGAPHGILANAVLPSAMTRMAAGVIGDRELDPIQSAFVEALDANLVPPIVIYLASKSCGFTQNLYSALAGRFARVFVGLSEGWFAGRGSQPTVEDIEAHLAQIQAQNEYTVPASVYDEMAAVIKQLDIRA